MRRPGILYTASKRRSAGAPKNAENCCARGGARGLQTYTTRPWGKHYSTSTRWARPFAKSCCPAPLPPPLLPDRDTHTERHRLHRGQVSRTRYGTRATCGLQNTKHGCVPSVNAVWRPGTRGASWGHGILRIPRRPDDSCIAGRRRYPEDTAVSSGYYRCPGDTRCPEDTGGILGMPSVSWGCHWYPEDTGVLISIKKTALFVLPLNTSLKSRAGARVLAKVCESPPTTPRPPVSVVRGAPARGPHHRRQSAACQRSSRSGATRALGAAALRVL